MALKVGINGFGRIGRLVFRAGVNNPNIEFVGINDLVKPDYLEYLLKYDSTHGKFKGTVSHDEENIIVNGKKIPCVSVRNPSDLPWSKVGADYVVESTGLFTDYAGAEGHITAGAKRVVISAPTKDPSASRRCSWASTKPSSTRRRTRSSATPAAPPTAWPRSRR